MNEFLNNHVVQWIGAGVAFLVAFVLFLKIVEIVVGLRKRFPRGAKSRQLRLGFVEAFELDGERQLLLVRRDNVEHLLLIGGPNDVLVESGIVRAEPREARPPRAGAESPQAPVAQAQVAQAPAAQTHVAIAAASESPPPPLVLPPMPPAPAPAQLAPQQAGAARPEPAPVAPPAPPPVERPAPRFQPPPRQMAGEGAAAAPRFTAPPRVTPAASPAGGEAPRPRFVMPPLARKAGAPEAPKPPEPAKAQEPPLVAAPPAPAPVAPPAPTPAVEFNFDADFEPLDSLEAEMAKLLGRPSGK
jgi:hypothetical protein